MPRGIYKRTPEMLANYSRAQMGRKMTTAHRANLSTAHTTHGQAGTSAGNRLDNSRTYESWRRMKQRCFNPNSPDYKYYGGRGIKVCDQWLTFDGFFTDMGDRPEGTSLDRIDNEGNYEPGNCRWATPLTQRHNRRK